MDTCGLGPGPMASFWCYLCWTLWLSYHSYSAISHACEKFVGRWMAIDMSRTMSFYFFKVHKFKCGPGSSAGIATDLRAGRFGIESRWGRDFPPVQTGPGTYPTSCKMGTGSFTGVKCGRGVLLTTHPLLVPRSWKSRAIPLPTVSATPAL